MHLCIFNLHYEDHYDHNNKQERFLDFFSPMDDLMASSKTDFTPTCVRDEHSTYVAALIFLAIEIPCDKDVKKLTSLKQIIILLVC